RKLELDIGGRGAFGGAGALRLLPFGVILLLAEVGIGPGPSRPHFNLEGSLRGLAQKAVRPGLPVRGERTGVAAFRIVRAADEGAELAGLEIELAGAAGRALPDVAAIRTRRIDVRPQHVVEHVEHFGDAKVLDVVDRTDEVAPEILQHLL